MRSPSIATLVTLSIATLAVPAAAAAFVPDTGPPGGGPANPDEDFPKLSPFTAVETRDGAYHVRFEGEWYELVSLAGFDAARLRAYCDETFGSRSEKRFAEDLIEVLAGLGHEPGKTVDLVLEGESGERVSKKGAPLTEANRRAVRMHRAVDREAPPVRRVERTHDAAVPARVAARVAPLAGLAPAGRTLTREAAAEDLDQLEWLLAHTHSYADLTGSDYRAALDAIRASLTDENDVGQLALQLSKLIADLGDGHASVDPLGAGLPPGFAPFLLIETAGGIACVRPDRSGLLDPERPFVVGIDGRPIEDWMRAAAVIVPSGSDAHARFRALRNLRMINWVRLELGATPAGNVEVELAAAGGSDAEKRTLRLARRKPIYGTWPRAEGRADGATFTLLEGDVGHLRIPSMSGDPAFIGALHAAMAELADTRGLVIDVRGNGGGSRDALRTLLPYFLDPAGPPRVVNIAAYKLRPGDSVDTSEGYLANRFLYPRTSRRWSPDELAALDAARATFAPQWELPAGFSDWHYMLVSPTEDPARHYSKPVVLLLDTACFSATDVFLGAFQGIPRITLLGTASGGGSGRSERARLANSGLTVRLSSMASFRANGSLYDGVGVRPDVVVEPIATDFVEGGTDSILYAALKRMR